MAKGNKKLSVAWIGIISAIFGAGGGAVFDYYFSAKSAIQAERRNQRVEAYLSFITAEAAAGMSPAEANEIVARYRLLIFGSRDVVEKLAAVYRERAKRTYNEEEKRELISKETAESIRVVDRYIETIQDMRSEYHPEDKVSFTDLKTVLCAAAAPCVQGYSVSHLFE
jgi:hypothetical protein